MEPEAERANNIPISLQDFPVGGNALSKNLLRT